MQDLKSAPQTFRSIASKPAQSNLQIIQGRDAQALLEDAEFLERWCDLHGRCPWATAFQSVGFATTWYRTYAAKWRPVLACQYGADGTLNGLMPLASDDSRLIWAGGVQAEYHAWLATPATSGGFILDALARLRSEFAGRTLEFRFAPAGLPIEPLLRDRFWKTRCIHKLWSRPLLRVGDGTETEKLLHKRRHNYKLNSLQKEGAITLRRLVDPAEVEVFLDDIIARYDARQQAVHQVSPFAADRMKRSFYLSLLNVPDLLHVTVLTAGDTFLAAHLGVCDQRTVHLGITAYSEDHARHYPGKILILKLGTLLATTGFFTFDLTPGGDGYKEQFANEHDQVHELKIYFSRWQALREQALRALRIHGGSVLRRFGWRRSSPSASADNKDD